MSICLKYSSWLCAMMLAVQTTASAQQTADPDALHQRMNALESKLDALIGLMEKQNTGTSSGERAVAEPQSQHQVVEPSVPDGFVPGLLLDVYASNLSIKKKMEWEEFSLPKSFPESSVVISARSNYSYADFLSDEGAKALGDTTGSLVGVAYSGYYNVLETGNHGFQLRISAPIRSVCAYQFYIENQRVIASGLGWEFGSPQQMVASSQATASLSPGLYEIKTFFFCSRYRNAAQEFDTLRKDEYQEVNVELLIAEPGDRAPKSVPADRLLIRP